MREKTLTKITILVNDKDEILTEPEDIANELAKVFANNSCFVNCNKIFKKHDKYPKIQMNNTTLNNEIRYEELIHVLKLCKNTSPDPDNIPNIMLKNYPMKGLEYITKLFNMIKANNAFPDRWIEATMTHIYPFKEKIREEQKNFKPIALTCIMCKLFETIIKKCLKCHVEEVTYFTAEQSGFRQKQSMLDHLIPLKKVIFNAFIKTITSWQQQCC